jgi:hypothetical protein
MSSWYFITPYDPEAWEDPNNEAEKPTSDLKIYRKDFQVALFDHWGPDRIKEDNSSALLKNVWSLTNPKDIDGDDLSIHLQDNYQVIEVHPGPKYVELEFVLWYRKFIAAKYPLYFFHSSSWDRLLLTADTTEQDLIDFTGVIS